MKASPKQSPNSFVSGDSVSFLVSASDFPAGEWSLKFSIATDSFPVVVEGTVEGLMHKVDIEPSVSETILPGDYACFFVLSKGGERVTVSDGFVRVLPNPLASMPDSWASRTLALVEEAITKIAAGTNTSVSINGQSFTKRSLSELTAFRDRLRMEVNVNLKKMGRPSSGGMKTIQTRFRP